MSTTVSIKATQTGLADYSNPNTPSVPGSTYTWTSASIFPHIGFNGSDLEAYKYNRIIGYPKLTVYLDNLGSQNLAIEIEALKGTFSANTLTYNNRPSVEFDTTKYYEDFLGYIEKSLEISNYSNEDLYALRNGVVLTLYTYYNSGYKLYTSSAANAKKPVIQIEFEDTKRYVIPYTNTSGIVDPSSEITLRYSTSVTNGPSIATPSVSSFVITWKESGSETEHQLSPGVNVLPANTLESSKTYSWKITVTDTAGNTTSSSWSTLDTHSPAATAPTLRSPDGTVEDGSEPIRFKWTNNSAGNNTGTDVVFSSDGSSWGDPIHLEQGVNSYDAPAGTFTSGTKYWRARAYNNDGTAGSWSGSKSFVVIAPPLPPSISVTNTPRPTVAWASEEQQAYQVRIGSYLSDMIYGTESSFKCPIFLEDGNWNVGVRVMNSYNLWSEWASQDIVVSNTPGASLTVAATGGEDVELAWTAVTGALSYMVYRDDVLITETTGLQHIDRWVIGTAEYSVRAVLSGDNYSMSIRTSTAAIVDHPMITEMNGQWIPLQYSTTPIASRETNTSQAIAIMRFSGAIYPVPEVSQHRERIYHIAAAFKLGQSDAFERLLGKECVLKDQYGNLVHGIIADMSKVHNQFYTECQADMIEIEGTL